MTYRVREAIKSVFIGTDTYREQINTRPHFIPLDLEILGQTLVDHLNNKSDATSALIDFRAGIIEFITSRHKIKLHVSGNKLYYNNVEITANNIIKYTPAVVYQGSDIIGALYSAADSYKSLSSGLFTPYLNKVAEDVLKKYKSHGGTLFNIGHVPVRSGTGQEIGTTPALEEALAGNDMLSSAIESEDLSSNKLAILLGVQNKYNKLVNDFFFVDHTYGPTIETTLSKDFKEALLSVNANIVVIQDARNNKTFGAKENELISRLKSLLLKIRFSRSLKEEVVTRIAATITGNPVNSTKISKKLDTIDLRKNIKQPISTKPQTINLGALRDPSSGRFAQASITNIRYLLNFHLHDVIAASMGDGTRKDILNYRTGRFATSARVDRVSVSRDGAVSAFYTYMKDPYATFSAGGRQQFPTTRDPKLLISKGIRDIATKIGIQRMRAILV